MNLFMAKRKKAMRNYMILIMSIIITTIAAWLTHIITCFQEEAWGFLIAGAVAFPVGILHGIWLWF